MTPHIAGITDPRNAAAFVVDCVTRAESGAPFRNVVDLNQGLLRHGQAGAAGSRTAAAELFIGAEQRGVFRKLPAFERDLSEYPELAVLAQNHAVIRAECEALVHSQVRIPGMEELTSYTSGGIHQIAWKSFMFKSGEFIEENCALAPKTAALLRGIPGVYTAFFSVLEPNQHIKAHWGYWKGFVRYHLGVVVPDNNRDHKCWIRINPDAQSRDGDRARDRAGREIFLA